MYLPDHIRACIDALEGAGFAAYAVGGCVRDALLGLTPHDYDLCTSARPDEIRRVFAAFRLVLAGEKHGTVSVIMGKEPVEITTFRTEGGYEDSRHPDWVRFVDAIEEDLSRRDFTVNAMAYSPTRGFADPFGGQEDLNRKILRAVGDPETRFTEDALRILRGVRFSVRYGLKPESATADAMQRLASRLDSLARERIFDELCKLLPLVTAEDLITFAPILKQVIPELGPAIGFDQHSPYHIYDLYTHIAHVTASVPPQPVLRWAALLHDIGKPQTFCLDEAGRGHFPDHAKLGAQMADAVLLRLKAPTALRQQVTDLIARHMTPLEPDIRILRRRLGKYGTEGTLQLLQLQRADFGSKGTGEETDVFQQIAGMIESILEQDSCLTVRDLAVNGHDLLALGIPPGPRLGACLEGLLAQVQNDTLPNDKTALLAAAQSWAALQ